MNDIVNSRESVYGEKVETHRRIAEVWSGITGLHIQAADVALMMIGLKAVRTQICPDYSDNSDDIDGYLDIFRAIVGDEMVQVRTVDQYLEVKNSDLDAPTPFTPVLVGGLDLLCKHCEEQETFHNPVTRACSRPGSDGTTFELVEV